MPMTPTDIIGLIDLRIRKYEVDLKHGVLPYSWFWRRWLERYKLGIAIMELRAMRSHFINTWHARQPDGK